MKLAKSIGEAVNKFINSKFSTILVILIFAFPWLIVLLATAQTERINYTRKDKNILDGYYDFFTYEIGITDYYRYEMYYYEPDYDNKFISNKNYNIIDENNIEETKELFEWAKRFVNDEPSKDKFDKFDLNQITFGDYVIIDRSESYEKIKSNCLENNSCRLDYNFTIYFYDVDTHILYMIEYFE